MRTFKATLAVAVVLGFAVAASAQSLGDLADKEKQKRQGKPAPKTITEADLARAGKKGTLSMPGSPEAPADAAAPADGSAPPADAATAEAIPPAEAVPEAEAEPGAENTPPVPEKAPEPAKPKGPPPKTSDELRVEKQAELQKKLDAARTNLTNHQNVLSQIDTTLGASLGNYSQARADLVKRQEEEKVAVAKFQAEITQLEEDIRRSAWSR